MRFLHNKKSYGVCSIAIRRPGNQKYLKTKVKLKRKAKVVIEVKENKRRRCHPI